jgi:hypothetical protein
MDVGRTADGVVVLSHDPILDTMLAAGLMGPASKNRARSFPGQAGGDWVQLPRLDEVIAFDPAVMLAVELKTFPDHPDWIVPPEAMADAVPSVLDAAGAGGGRG